MEMFLFSEFLSLNTTVCLHLTFMFISSYLVVIVSPGYAPSSLLSLFDRYSLLLGLVGLFVPLGLLECLRLLRLRGFLGLFQSVVAFRLVLISWVRLVSVIRVIHYGC